MTPRRRWYHLVKPKPRKVDAEVNQCFAFRIGNMVIASSAAVEALGGDQAMLTDAVFTRIPEKPEIVGDFDKLQGYLKKQFAKLAEQQQQLADQAAELAESNAKVISLEREIKKRDEAEAEAESNSSEARKARLEKKLAQQKSRNSRRLP